MLPPVRGEEHDIRSRRPSDRQNVCACRGFPDDVEPHIGLQRSRDTDADQWMIGRHDDPQQLVLVIL